MEIIGYLIAILIGISLGLLGSGGSILTVPLLVYFFGVPPVIATTYSLFIVGISGFTGSIKFFTQRLVDFRVVLLFGLPSIATIFLARRFILPVIPAEIHVVNKMISLNILIMISLAVLMLFSAVSMIRNGSGKIEKPASERTGSRFTLLFPTGLFIGLLTGLLGMGGGFVIIPILVLWIRIPMKKAIGSSLILITINSLVGFMLSLDQASIDWPLFSSITVIAVGGILIGSKIAVVHTDQVLKKGFGIFVLMMSVFIFIKEIFFS